MHASESAEIWKFNDLAAEWRDPDGPMAPLHWMNAARLDFIYAHLPDTGSAPCKILDVGCGAGLLCEPLARKGFQVTGIDLAEAPLSVARELADEQDLPIDYRLTRTGDEALGRHFDVVTALEIIEHVEAPDQFIKDCAKHLKPGGILFVSTINRTRSAWLKAIMGAEYVLGILPVGTHQWRQFVKPSEVRQWMREADLRPGAMTGMALDLAARSFTLKRDPSINYMTCATKLT